MLWPLQEVALQDELLEWVRKDEDEIVAFLREFIRARSPNPPGDTRDAMAVVTGLLDRHGIAYEIVARDPTMPNLVAHAGNSAAERHLVLNGHIDVFPVVDSSEWAHDPWGSEGVDDAIYGRGAADMKVGTTASLLTFIYLSRLQEKLKGRLTLTVVSDEETFGPNGARHLFETREDEITGTACLNGEPSGPQTVRFGEKGGVWLRFRVTTKGGHGAFPHVSPNAIDQAYALIQDLRRFTAREVEEPEMVRQALDAARDHFDQAYGAGASDLARKITMNVGTMSAGPKVNMIASFCEFEVDFRLPVGARPKDLLDHVKELEGAHAFTWDVLMINEPNWVSPDNDLTRFVRRRAKELTGIEPMDVVSMGNTDARLWRYRGVPAVVYGPTPKGMASFDEHVLVEDALNVVRCHVLAACDYLTA